MEITPKSPELPPLPFAYVRTYDETKAAYKEKRHFNLVIDGKEDEPRTDEQILAKIKRERENRDWFVTEYWRRKKPEEQLELSINDKLVTIYNFNKDKPFTNEYVVRTQIALAELGSHFPHVTDKLNWILIEDEVTTSDFGDPEKFPLNGHGKSEWSALILQPRVMDLIPHRIEKASNFEGTLAHEITHLIANEFQKEWHSGGFRWDFTFEHPDDWETRTTPDGIKRLPFNKKTGEMAPHSRFPLQPEQCVSYYAKIHPTEDICESMAAYIYNPELLKKISPVKFEILQRHDARQPKPDVLATRIPKDQIKLPEIKPETVYYFIKEPQS